MVALSAGLVFNTISVSLPKIVDERVGNDISLVAVGGLTTAVFLCGALAQLTVGRLVERIPPHILFATLPIMQFSGVVWAAYASGVTLLFALAFTMAAIYGQITVNDLVIARYTADAWRGRVYAVRYFLTFMISGVAVSMIARALWPRRLRPGARRDRDGRDGLFGRGDCDRDARQWRGKSAPAAAGGVDCALFVGTDSKRACGSPSFHCGVMPASRISLPKRSELSPISLPNREASR